MIDATKRRRLRRPVEWLIGLAATIGIVVGVFGLATLNISRPLTIGSTSVAAVLLGGAGATAVWRLQRGAGEQPVHRRGRAAWSVAGFAVVISLWFVSVSVASGVSGWTPRGWLREVVTGSGQLATLPLDTSPPMQADLYFGALSTIVHTVHDAPDFATDYALAGAQPDLCAAVVVASDLAVGTGSITASFSGPRWTVLESVQNGDIGGLTFIRQSLLTPPDAEPTGVQIIANVTIRADRLTATGRYSVELLGASGSHRLWSVQSGAEKQVVECAQYHVR